MVCDCEDAELIAHDRVDDAERKTACDEPPFAVAPYRSEMWVLQ